MITEQTSPATTQKSEITTVRAQQPWKRIIHDPKHHFNDFCLFHALDGRWHCIGIQGNGTWASETGFFHASSDELYGEYSLHKPLLCDLEFGETANYAPQKHAPFVIERDSVYHLYFRQPNGTNLLLKSRDLFHWPRTPKVLFEENDARDVCIQKFGDAYHYYYCQWLEVDGTDRACILLRRSDDLEDWSDATTVHVDTSVESEHAHLESPFVIRHGNEYLLFVRNRLLDEKCVTTVFTSRTPDSFASGVRAWDFELENIHAPEIVEHNGKFYIARVSGPPDHLPGAPKRGGYVELAELVLE